MSSFGKFMLMLNIGFGSFGAVMAVYQAFNDEMALVLIGIGMAAVGYGFAISVIFTELRVALREHRVEMEKMLSFSEDREEGVSL